MKGFRSKLLAVFILPLFLSLSGCVYLVVGGIGALGGYVVSPDTVEGLTENDFITVWDAAIDIVSVMGIITEQHEEGGVLIAKINGAKVTITISSVKQTLTKLTIKSRKAYLPKIRTSQDVFVKIMSYINE